MRYDAVIFDLFGTLVDSSPSEEIHEMLAGMAAALGMGRDDFFRLWLDETRRRRSVGEFPSIEANLEHVCATLGLPFSADTIRSAARIREVFTRRAMTPRPDAIPTLERLGRLGYRRGLISDCSPDVPVIWCETPLAAHIDAPIFSCRAGLEKPDPRIYALACERLGVGPERCLYVGDGDSHELTGATRAGMDAVLIRAPHDRGLRRREDSWTGRRIASLAEVLAIVDD